MKHLFKIILLLLCTQVYGQKSDFEHIDFKKADSIAKLHNRRSLKNMPLLVYELTHNLDTQVEQFRAIHTWVCFNIESDHFFSASTIKKRRQLKSNKDALAKWNKKTQSKVYKRLVRSKKTICTGYAYILKALCKLADIECEIVDGYARNSSANVDSVDYPNHSWNVVKLNGKWYFADTTQASGYYNLDENRFVKNYSEGYFLPLPELFAKNHFPIDTDWLLLDEKLTLQEFVKKPLIYVDIYNSELIPILPNTLVTSVSEGDIVIFEFKVLESSVLKDIHLEIDNGYTSRKMMPLVKTYDEGILKIQYRFEKKGQFDVHTKVGENIVSSCTIKVKKSPVAEVQHN